MGEKICFISAVCVCLLAFLFVDMIHSLSLSSPVDIDRRGQMAERRASLAEIDLPHPLGGYLYRLSVTKSL